MTPVNSNKSALETLEEAFLKIFKITLLVVMALALLVAIGFAVYSASLYLQSPATPKPAVAAPAQTVQFEKFLNELLPPEPKAERATGERQLPEATKQPREATQSFLAATALWRCSDQLAKIVGLTVPAIDSADDKKRIEALSTHLERLAHAKKSRGNQFIDSMVQFVCASLSNPKLVAVRKEGNVTQVFSKLINFHIKEWDRIQESSERFRLNEKRRINDEISAENARVAQEKAQSVITLAIAGVAFAIFMLVALYLIFAKIETNLRGLKDKP